MRRCGVHVKRTGACKAMRRKFHTQRVASSTRAQSPERRTQSQLLAIGRQSERDEPVEHERSS